MSRTRTWDLLPATPHHPGICVTSTPEIQRKAGRGTLPGEPVLAADPRWLLLDLDGPNGRRARIEALLAAGKLDMSGCSFVAFAESA